MPKAIFLDRDGTLIEDVHYLKDPNDIKLIDGVELALRNMKNAGYLIFLHTNQSGISRGYYNLEDVNACNKKMMEMYNMESNFWDGICIAAESPDTHEQLYRKPSNKYQLEMIEKFDLQPSECWMVGDKWIDVETGLNSSMNAALVQTGKEITLEIQKLAFANKVPICNNLFSFSNSHLLQS